MEAKYDLNFGNNGYKWIDVINPTKEDLRQLAVEFHLPQFTVEDCMDPYHLPKTEKLDHLLFVILRTYDPESTVDADTVQELTRKLAIFWNGTFLITLHRKELDFVKNLREKYGQSEQNQNPQRLMREIFFEIIIQGLMTYHGPIDRAISDLGIMEACVLLQQGKMSSLLREAYYLKSKMFLIKRMIRMSLESWNKVIYSDSEMISWQQELKDTADDLLFYADDFLEAINHLLTMYMSIESQKTNEVMRVLAVFSALFLPLNLIAGIYGMNFSDMPELKYSWGYPAALSLMLTVAISVFWWFKRNGWISSK